MESQDFCFEHHHFWKVPWCLKLLGRYHSQQKRHFSLQHAIILTTRRRRGWWWWWWWWWRRRLVGGWTNPFEKNMLAKSDHFPPYKSLWWKFQKNSCFNHHLDGWSFSSTSPLGILLSNLLAGPTSAWRVPNMPRAGFGSWNSARRTTTDVTWRPIRWGDIFLSGKKHGGGELGGLRSYSWWKACVG